MTADKITAEKKEIRKRIKEMRAGLSPDAQRQLSGRIFDRVRAAGLYEDHKTIFVYMSMPGEVQTRDFMEKAWAGGKRIAVPRTDMKTHEIHFFYIDSFSQVRPGVMGIPEPVQETECADEDEDALMIMPGLAFDRDRRRVGYGGGFYDRYLEKHPGHPTAAVAFDFQIFEKVPSDRHDRRPDFLFTPSGVIARTGPSERLEDR